MGNALSSCYCCGDEAGGGENQMEDVNETYTNKTPRSPRKSNKAGGGPSENASHVTNSILGGGDDDKGGKKKDDAKLRNMYRDLEEGLDVSLILQDRNKLDCKVKLDVPKSAVLLSCDRKVRTIALQDIKNLLCTEKDLKRVDYAAGIEGEDNCVAIHLHASGNCIPLFFKTAQDKECFVVVMHDMKQSHPAT